MNREDYKQLTVKQLKAKCKELGLHGYGRMSEDELIDLILSKETEGDEVDDIVEPQSTVENKEALDNTKETESSMVTFKKLIKGAFGFNGKTFKGSTFELSEKEADNPKIKNAIKGGLIEIK